MRCHQLALAGNHLLLREGESCADGTTPHPHWTLQSFTSLAGGPKGIWLLSTWVVLTCAFRLDVRRVLLVGSDAAGGAALRPERVRRPGKRQLTVLVNPCGLHKLYARCYGFGASWCSRFFSNWFSSLLEVTGNVKCRSRLSRTELLITRHCDSVEWIHLFVNFWTLPGLSITTFSSDAIFIRAGHPSMTLPIISMVGWHPV